MARWSRHCFAIKEKRATHFHEFDTTSMCHWIHVICKFSWFY